MASSFLPLITYRNTTGCLHSPSLFRLPVEVNAGNLQPFHGFGTARKMVDRVEDQFALSPGVAGVDDLAHFL